jgi:hypothetical protein
MDKAARMKLKKSYEGADLLMFHSKRNDPGKFKRFRSILACRWSDVTKEAGIKETACILGAFYGIRKSYYEHINGFHGHKVWGCLEPMISLKVWLTGGRCLCDKDILVFHIFSRRGRHRISKTHILYNKLLTAHLLFDDELLDRLINFVRDERDFGEAMAMVKKDIKALRDEMKPILVRKLNELEDRVFIDTSDKTLTNNEIKATKRYKKMAFQKDKTLNAGDKTPTKK